jgi:Polysaccharide lyase
MNGRKAVFGTGIGTAHKGIVSGIVAASLMAMIGTVSAQPAAFPQGDGWHNLFDSDWHFGIDSAVLVQRVAPEDLLSVPDPVKPTGKALQAAVETDEDFSGVANGSPRSELVFPRTINFEVGSEYVVRWSTLIPRNVQINAKYPAVIAQVHQGSLFGSPPIALMVSGTHYQLLERDGSGTTVRGPLVCCSDTDRGVWVHWLLDYAPDSSGRQSRTRLWKDGVLVHASQNVPNAYPHDSAAYLKMGIYGPGWKSTMSGPLRMRLLIGPVSIFKRQLSKAQ